MKMFYFKLVDPPGFEPRQTVQKTVVLPLHHGSLLKLLQRYNFFFIFLPFYIKKMFFFIFLCISILAGFLTDLMQVKVF